MNKFLSKLKDYLCDLIYPKHIKCIFCDEELDERAKNDTCVDCKSVLPYITRPCLRCGKQISDGVDLICFDCKNKNFAFTSAHSVFEYSGIIISAVHRFKYSRQKFLYEPFAEYMCDKFATLNITPDIITSVPLHTKREHERGYNQAKLLARFISERFKIKYMDLCDKIKDNPSQTELDFKARQENVLNAYKLILGVRKEIKDKSILIIDDIFTTGATTNEISKLFLEAGASDINVLTFAHAQHETKY